MPRNVRNFWIEAQIDGRASQIAAGPVKKDGGFDLEIMIRDKGWVSRCLDIIGRALPDGTLSVQVIANRAADTYPETQESRAIMTLRSER